MTAAPLASEEHTSGAKRAPGAKLANHPNLARRTMLDNERAVLVTTAHRGVFFGWANDTSGDTIRLRGARLCVYWSGDVRGFMGLAANGPTNSCRIGPPANIEVRNVTSVVEVTPQAIERWEKSPWA